MILDADCEPTGSGGQQRGESIRGSFCEDFACLTLGEPRVKGTMG